jgi:hypothetical protein
LVPINTQQSTEQGERRDRKKRQGRDRKKKGAENRGTKKNQRKREPITKKHKSKGKNNILWKTITFISISANHLRRRQVRPSFSLFVSAFFSLQKKGNRAKVI